MRLQYDFSELKAVVAALQAQPVSFALTREASIEAIDLELREGKSLELGEIDFASGLPAVANRQVLLYIPDQQGAIEDVLAGEAQRGRRYHVADCSTIQDLRHNGRFHRFTATHDLSGLFRVHGVGRKGGQLSGEARLQVCQNCLTALNYGNCRQEGAAWKIAKEFSIDRFFERYASCFQRLPDRRTHAPEEDQYAEDWRALSLKAREDRGWRCSKCLVVLDRDRSLLHVHHRNGVRGDNSASNLQVLCKACHRDQPHHDHMAVPREEMKRINQLRRSQGLMSARWKTALTFVDSALRDALRLAETVGLPAPEIEFSVGPRTSLDVAWPALRLGIDLSPSAGAPEGWRILSLPEALSFEFFAVTTGDEETPEYL